jgi:molybdopterin-guanine dinucleotide biosynthesis protein A
MVANEDNKAYPPIAILAGGKSTRFNRLDKASIKLGHKRLIDHILDKFSVGTQEVIISGTTSYETGLTIIPDDPKFNGPAAGLSALAKYFNASDTFITVPLDTPFLPVDLLPRLTEMGPTSVAKTDDGLHPTIGIWAPTTLDTYFAKLEAGANPSLHKVAEECLSKHVEFSNAVEFMNINDDRDLALAHNLLKPV